MEPGGEIKFARIYTARSLNLDRAGAFAKIKFYARTRCFGKDAAAKTRLLDYLRSASFISRIGAILYKINKFRIIRL